MFHSARLKLTLWYLLIILLISGTISSLFYFRAVSVMEAGFRRFEHRWQEEFRDLPFPNQMPRGPRFVPEDIAVAKQELFFFLFLINGIIGVGFFIGGYFLAGKTLQPIEQAMEEQKRFIGDAAHELKTPITALKTSLEVNLMDKDLDTKSHNILRENLEDVASLESLTKSLLHLARLDGQQSKFSEINLTEIIDRAIKHVRPLAKKKNVTLNTNQISQKLMIKGDKEMILDLLLIFLDNAIKFSPEKSQISLIVKPLANQVVIKIKDTGIGIAKHHLPHIFDRFYRVDQARSNSDEGGHGLGLAVAKQIIDQHHGSVSVKSEVGKGTTFTIKLPGYVYLITDNHPLPLL